jgi:hypothetical protein
VKVVAYVLANRRVWATPGFDGSDPFRRKRMVPMQELGVFSRENVVGDDAQADLVTKRLAEREHESGLPTSNGSSDTDRERATPKVAALAWSSRMKQSWMSPRFVAVSVLRARSVVMRVFGVMSHGVILSSTLKKPGIQPIVQGSDDVEHRSRRRGLVDTQRPACGEHLVERRTVPTLQSLSLVGAHQTKPNGRGNDSAQAHVEIQT